MRRSAISIIFLILLSVILLTGCAALYANAQGEPDGAMIIQDDGENAQEESVIVTLKPESASVKTPESTPSPIAVPSLTPTYAPVYTPTLTPTPSSTPVPVTPEPAPTFPNPQNAPELVEKQEGVKTCYLTFDDGPSKNTEAILKVLTEKEVVATFFVIGDNAARYPEKLTAIVEQGSLVANHTQTHKTDKIYTSAEALMADLENGRQTILSILGEEYVDDLMRFPYGSTNRRCREYRDEVLSAGYRYFDWNALNGDAESGASKRSVAELYEYFVETVDRQANRGRDLIILLHDTSSKEKTVEMLDDAIDYIRSLGYTFATLENVPMN